MTLILFSLFITFLLIGLILTRWSRAGYQRTGLPPGRVVYADTGAWGRPERSLFSRRYLLTGKPDYLVERKGRKIPVEVKTTTRPHTPYRSHILQLAAYCLLVEEEYGQPPPYGLIKYRDDTLAVDYTPQLQAQLLDTLQAMRAAWTAADVAPNHANPNRCRRCGYRDDCSLSL